jgi:pimeloyl-ACP methyl ester carboxylesterase
VATYVLVHGAWGGAHGFRLVRPLLAARGHEVFTPSLTGIGERSHLASPQVNLSTHVQDVVSAIWYEDLQDVVLLGFSYGGMVVTGALEHIADRVAHLVYLDAFVPRNGQSLYDLTGQERGRVLVPGEEWLVQPPPRSYDEPEQAAFADPRRSPHPVGCFTEPVRLRHPLEQYPLSRMYIKATAEPGPDAFVRAGHHARTSPAWDYREIATNHLVPVNRPGELADILLELG